MLTLLDICDHWNVNTPSASTTTSAFHREAVRDVDKPILRVVVGELASVELAVVVKSAELPDANVSTSPQTALLLTDQPLGKLNLPAKSPAAFAAESWFATSVISQVPADRVMKSSGSSSGVGYLEMTGYDKPIRLE